MPSIRNRLLVHLLIIVTVSWLVQVFITYYEAHHEIEELFDAELAQSAGIIAELVLKTADPQAIAPGSQLARAQYGHKYERKISFQIWEDDTLILRSQNAPAIPLATHSGFNDIQIDGGTWRVFTMPSVDGRYTVYTAESDEIRHELIYDITGGAIIPLLVALPAIVLLVWLGIGRGLRPLQRVASEVGRRSPHQLTPINGSDIPREILPLSTALNNLLHRLQAAFDMERRFTSDASHELRTPLAGIKTQAQVALRASKKEEREHALHNIIQGVDRSTHLVEQMLTLARLEPESANKEFQAIDLARLAEKAISELLPQADEHRIELSLENHYPPALGCTIQGFEPGLLILLRNLLDNAVRYSTEGGSVTVALFQEYNRCCLTVTDTGPGIAETERQRVFDRFYRPDGQSSYGCGLGLSIAQHIAQIHGADILLSSPPSGQGLRVTVLFPITP